MTRLDSVIRRLTAQRDLLDWAAEDIGPTGLILELGLGNGRTYDHLRTKLPGRKIYAFERSPAAHPDCYPPEGYLIVGDIFETLPAFIERFGQGSAALIHTDIGTEYVGMVQAAEWGPERVREFVGRVFDGASEPLLLHLVKDSRLSAKDREQLLRMIKETK